MIVVFSDHTQLLSKLDNFRSGSVFDVASDVGANLCNGKSCLNTSNNEILV